MMVIKRYIMIARLTFAVLDLLRENIERNHLSAERCSVASLSWGESLPSDVAQGVPYDVVLASDVMYGC